jgi:hypothetical protein
MAYFNATLKSSSDKTSPCLRPLLIGKLSYESLPIRTLLWCRFPTNIHLLYIIRSLPNKCIYSINTVSWIVPSGVTHLLILVLGFYSGLPGTVKTVYLFSLCVVSLLSSRFASSALVWFSNFLKYLVCNFFISLKTVFFCISSWILWLFLYQGAFRMGRRV